MNPQNSTLIQALLGELSQASSTWYDTLLPYARTIFFTLVGFQLLWSTITFALGKRQGDEFISMLFIMVIDVGFFFALMLHPDWVLDIINSFRTMGRQASHIERLSPDAIIDTGLRLASAIVWTVSNTGLFGFAMAVLLSAFIALAVLASFAFIAARMVLIIAEIFFAVNISPMLLAFSGLSATRYVATQYIGFVIGAGIQLLVMYLLIGAGLDIAARWAEVIFQSGSIDINAFMLVGLASALYAVLVWNLPKLIGGLASGAPQMSSGGIAAAAAGFGSGIQVGRAIGRGSVEGGQSFINTARAAAANFSARRDDAGSSRSRALFGTALATSTGAAASGVNTILGRYGHRSTAERVWTSTAKIKAGRKEEETGAQSGNDGSSENSAGQSGTAAENMR